MQLQAPCPLAPWVFLAIPVSSTKLQRWVLWPGFGFFGWWPRPPATRNPWTPGLPGRYPRPGNGHSAPPPRNAPAESPGSCAAGGVRDPPAKTSPGAKWCSAKVYICKGGTALEKLFIQYSKKWATEPCHILLPLVEGFLLGAKQATKSQESQPPKRRTTKEPTPTITPENTQPLSVENKTNIPVGFQKHLYSPDSIRLLKAFKNTKQALPAPHKPLQSPPPSWHGSAPRAPADHRAPRSAAKRQWRPSSVSWAEVSKRMCLRVFGFFYRVSNMVFFRTFKRVSFYSINMYSTS